MKPEGADGTGERRAGKTDQVAEGGVSREMVPRIAYRIADRQQQKVIGRITSRQEVRRARWWQKRLLRS